MSEFATLIPSEAMLERLAHVVTRAEDVIVDLDDDGRAIYLSDLFEEPRRAAEALDSILRQPVWPFDCLPCVDVGSKYCTADSFCGHHGCDGHCNEGYGSIETMAAEAGR